MKIILASKSGVRKQILEKNNVDCEVIVSNVDEDQVKKSLLSERADPLTVSKNLAELNQINDDLIFLSFTNKIDGSKKNIISAGVNSISQFNAVKKFQKLNGLEPFNF